LHLRLCVCAAGARTMTEYTSTIRDAFFSRETVVGTVTQCVRSLSHFTEDPLMSFANVGMQKPLSFTITTQGLCPFEDNVHAHTTQNTRTMLVPLARTPPST
jgi:hypothetical protein